MNGALGTRGGVLLMFVKTGFTLVFHWPQGEPSFLLDLSFGSKRDCVACGAVASLAMRRDTLRWLLEGSRVSVYPRVGSRLTRQEAEESEFLRKVKRTWIKFIPLTEAQTPSY
ncbi:hypothetical protein FVEG_15187 [Fusarium verticillioides 7600]|uniref:Uncharacterized protein n=1 Tax=Gibberella moniliformis (strain M3125 / FGSC 7600) TaxID=334819 RepID=W7LNA1_GIBM7|nr:hypothetical protein FVEG_15187 [Fusarium verticillioides 7600]EWG40868.1 hypothetical protein FVEG_15187 [Fusarium verticillioides 7600]